MKFIVCGDCHFTSKAPVCRSDNVLDTSVRKFRDILALAKEHAANVLIAGDVCDRPRDWYLLPQLMEACAEYKTVPIYAVYGQHDMYMRSEDRHATVLGVLAHAGMIKIVTNKGVWFGANKPSRPWCIHGCSWGDTIPEVETGSNLQQRYQPHHGLLIHASIAKEALFPGHEFISIADVFEKHPYYEFIVCGDVHRRFLAIGPHKQICVNTGPIMRLEATDYAMRLMPAVLLYDADTRRYQWLDICAAKGSDVLQTEHLKEREERTALLDTFVASVGQSTRVCRAQMADRLMEWMQVHRHEYPKVVEVLADVCSLSIK